MRKIMLLVIFVITMIALQIGQVNDVFAGKKWNGAHGKAFKCSIAGVWEQDDGSLMTIAPLDPTGKRFSIIMDTPKPTRFNEDGSVNYVLGLMHGTIDKIGPNLYDNTFYRYGVAEEGGANVPVILVIARAQTKFVDCDTRVTTSAFQVYYRTSEGSFEPMPGYCVKATGYSYRIKLASSPCVDVLDPFPDE